MRLAVLLVLILLVLQPQSGAKTCQDVAGYQVCFNLSIPHDFRPVNLPSDEIILTTKKSFQKTILAKGKVNIICNGKERAWILFQEFYRPTINDQNDQTAILESLKNEEASPNVEFNAWKNGGHKAVARKTTESVTSTIVLYWIGKSDKKTRCIIYSELPSKYTSELLESVRIEARA